DPVELRHTDGHFVAAHLGGHPPRARIDEVGLPRRGAETRIRLHALHQDFEVAGRQIEIQIELAKIVKLRQGDCLQARIESFDHCRPNASSAAVRKANDAEIWHSVSIALEYRSRLIGGPIIDHYPECWRNGLRHDALERPAHVSGLVTTRRDDDISARRLD